MTRDATPTLRLRKPLERTLASGHPWVWRDAVEPEREPYPAGTIVTVTDARGRFVARGYADDGPIAVRVLATTHAPVDRSLLARRLEAAERLRDRFVTNDTNAYRLVHGEGDRLPGIVCDVYGAHAVVAVDSAGARVLLEWMRDLLLETLARRGVSCVLLRSGRRAERVVEPLVGSPPAGPVEVREHGVVLVADLISGQKTGLFLDHRESRRRVRALARGLSVLDLYGYTGGFSAAAGLGGATAVTTVDVAPAALGLARATWLANGLDPSLHTTEQGDAPALLASMSRANARYDVVIADPPSFAPSEGALAAALRSYQALHESALRLLSRDGLYLAASCSSHVGREAFEQTIRDAARRRGVVLQVLDRWGAPPDHPRLLAFPEGDYLKAVLVRLA